VVVGAIIAPLSCAMQMMTSVIIAVIASEAKQSSSCFAASGLLRFARNDVVQDERPENQ